MLTDESTILCPICHKEYDTPIILPCGESICSKCINPLGEESDNFLCKLCNTIHEIPTNGFQLNKALIKVIETKNQSIPNPQVEKRINCFLEIENRLDRLKKDFENCKENIKDSTRLILNEIEVVADLKCKEINQVRDDLIEKVLNYERVCLENYTNYSVEYFNFLNEIKPYENNKEAYVKENWHQAELLKSLICIESQKFKNQISNFEFFEFRKNPNQINPDILGGIYEQHLDPINISEFIRLDFSKHFNNSAELRRYPKIKKLNPQLFLIAYVQIYYGININTLSNNIYFKLVLEVHDFNQCLRKFEIDMGQNQSDFIIQSNEGIIILNMNNFLWSLDFNLNELSKTNMVSPIKNLIISKNLIFCLSRSEFGATIQVYDLNLNFLKIYSSLNQNILHLPKETEAFFVNENFYFFQENNVLVMVDRDNGKFVKKISINDDLRIIRVTNENVIVGHAQMQHKILFLDFNGAVRDDRSIGDTLGYNIEIMLNDNYSFEFIDSQNLTVYI
ncbi:unnamed protein product [Brachionus calyciflorus]|uniref:RING-type domain-containing protein n=1 Tax=Brachionus calyciflorus TaxID=104777 RepID=A0A813T8X3_9BILA|nr:unnamed protein product [Brachionus calyciflorus]